MPSCCASSVELLAPAAGDERRSRRRAARPVGRLARRSRQHGVGVHGGRRAAQDDRVARLEAQRGGVDRHVRARLVDDGDDAERDAHLAARRARWAGDALDDLTDRVGQRGDRARAVGDAAHARLVERQAVEQSRREPGLAAGLQVARVGLQDLGVRASSASAIAAAPRPCARVDRAPAAARRPSRRGDIGDGRTDWAMVAAIPEV